MKQTKSENQRKAKTYFKASLSNNSLDPKKINLFVNLIKKQHKSSVLDLLKRYLELIKKHKNRNTIMIETAIPVDKKIIQYLTSLFEKTEDEKYEAKVVLNKEIIGGLKLTIGDTQYDYSLKGKLNVLKEVINV